MNNPTGSTQYKSLARGTEPKLRASFIHGKIDLSLPASDGEIRKLQGILDDHAFLEIAGDLMETWCDKLETEIQQPLADRTLTGGHITQVIEEIRTRLNRRKLERARAEVAHEPVTEAQKNHILHLAGSRKHLTPILQEETQSAALESLTKGSASRIIKKLLKVQEKSKNRGSTSPAPETNAYSVQLVEA
jgi:hypothetical protein